MANTVISLKKSGTPSATPASLEFGELAINYADGKIFYKAANGTIYSISDGSAYAFATVNANGTLVTADTTSDVFSLEAGQNINIVGDAINDKITIGANLNPVYDFANGKFLSNSTGTFAGALTTTGQIFANAQVTISATDGASEGGEISLRGSGSYDTKSIDSFNDNVRIFTVSTNNNILRVFNAGGGTFGLDVQSYALVNGMNLVPTIQAAYNQANTSGSLGIVFDTANAAFAQANSVSSDADEKANAAIITANAAYDKANSANLLAFNTGIGANAYAAIVGTSANAFTSSTIAGANAAVGAGANSYASAVGVAANTVGSAAFAKANANNGIGNSTSGQVLFNDAGISNGNSALTFNKTTGTLNVSNINITGTASYISANSIIIGDSEVNSIILITSTTNDQIIDSFANTAWRSAHYHITMNAGTDYQATQISLIHDGFKAYMTEYGMIANANNLGIFTTVVTGNSVRLNIIPTFSTTTIRMFRTTNR